MFDLEPGILFDGRFLIKRKLGEGGFGVVFEAFDEPLNRVVAIKLLKASALSEPGSRRRFLREGKILSALQSEALVKLYSVNIAANGLLYMVMELVCGVTLREKLNEEAPLTEAQTISIAANVLRALKVLEDASIVHRDLKPDNIMLTSGAEEGVKLLDFGLSGLLSQNAVKDSKLTASGTMLGSVFYMAPEICMGEKPTISSDFYSLGCVLYECITGRPPFDGAEPSAVVFQHVSSMPESPRVYAKTSSKFIETLLLKLLQKDPALRFTNCEQIMSAVQTEHLLSDTVPGDLMPFGSGDSRVARCSRWSKTAVGILTLALVSLTAVLLYPKTSVNIDATDQRIATLATSIELASQEDGDLEHILPPNVRPKPAAQYASSESKLSELLDILQSKEKKHAPLSKDSLMALDGLIHRFPAERSKQQLQTVVAALKYDSLNPATAVVERSKFLNQNLFVIANRKQDIDETGAASITDVLLAALHPENRDMTIELRQLLQIARMECFKSRRSKLRARIFEIANTSAVKSLIPIYDDLLRAADDFGDIETEKPLNREFARLLMKVDLARNASPAYFAKDNFLLARAQDENKSKARLLETSVDLFKKSNTVSIDRIQATTTYATTLFALGEQKRAREVMQDAELLATKLHGDKREAYAAYSAVAFGWARSHKDHSETIPACFECRKFVAAAGKAIENTDDKLEQMYGRYLRTAMLYKVCPESALAESTAAYEMCSKNAGNGTAEIRYATSKAHLQYLYAAKQFARVIEVFEAMNNDAGLAPYLQKPEDRETRLRLAGSAYYNLKRYKEALATWQQYKDWSKWKPDVDDCARKLKAEAKVNSF